MKRIATVYTETGGIVLVIQSISREGNKLVLTGKALGTMTMDMVLPLQEVFNAIKLLFCWDVISLILLLPFFGIAQIFKLLNKKNKAM